MCKCKFCNLSKRINYVTKNGSHQQKNRLIRELAALYWNTDAELDYQQAINDGSWFTAVEILEKRLENATSIRNQKLMLEQLEG